jgi:hypothetical protein
MTFEKIQKMRYAVRMRTTRQAQESVPEALRGIGGVRQAYHRFRSPSRRPLLLLQNFRGITVSSDLAVINPLPACHGVIPFDDAVVGGFPEFHPGCRARIAHPCPDLFTGRVPRFLGSYG